MYHKKLLAAIMCAAMVICGAVPATGQLTAMAATEEEVAAAAAELDAAKQALAEAEANLAAKQAELEGIDAQIAEKQKIIDDNAPQLEALQAKLMNNGRFINPTMMELINALKAHGLSMTGPEVEVLRIDGGEYRPSVGIPEIDDLVIKYADLKKTAKDISEEIGAVKAITENATTDIENMQAQKAAIEDAIPTLQSAIETAKAEVVQKQAAYDALSSEPSTSSLPFEDVNVSDWYYDGVADLYAKSLMFGMNPTTFGPELEMNRAFMAAVMYRRAGSPETPFEPVFPDVKETDWFAECSIWARATGNIFGYEDGNFGATDLLNREQLCTILWRYATTTDGGDDTARADLSEYPDVDKISDFANESISWCVATGIFVERDGRIAAWEPVTRAEFAVMLSRYLQVVGAER